MPPPPMMTQRAWGGRRLMETSILFELGVGPLEAGEIVAGVGAIIEVEGRMDLRHHAPHRFAQERGAFHRAIAPAEPLIERALEIGFEKPILVLGRDLVVGAEIAKVEERAVEAGIIPVDEPEPRPVIDEVRWQQIVMAIDDVDRADGGLQHRAGAEQAGKLRNPAALSLAQRGRVVPDDMEDPE